MDERWLSLLAAIGLCIVMSVIYAWWYHRTRVERAEEQAKYANKLDQLVKAGLRTPNGDNTCMVCGITATKYMPISGTSWMDRLPLLNRLFSLPPRYVIDDNLAGDFCLCRVHKSVAVRRMEEFHALLRAERAKFNAMHEEKVAAMDGGELMRVLMTQHGYQLKRVRGDVAAEHPVPQLQASVKLLEDEDIAVVSGIASIPPEEA